MNVRRSATALAVIAVTLAGGGQASAASPSPSAALPAGLYGTGDPTYDGVWRQSLALLAQDTVGVKPADAAVEWLTGQQCASGAFAPFRADSGTACGAKTLVDTNSTGAAVQALAALGGQDAGVGKAVAWLKSVQNADGGWGYTAGGASDANSTSVVVGALAAAGEKPGEVTKGGKSPYDLLLKLALPCDAAGGGAFAYQPDKKGKLAANDDATAAAVVGVLGKGFAGEAAKPGGSAPACSDSGDPAQAASNGAAHLVQALAKDRHLTSALAGAEDQPDYGNTADAVVALATAGQGQRAADALRWLEASAGPWAKEAGPAAYAQLILAAHAGSADPRDFGGQDLVTLLDATGPAPASVPASASPTRTADDIDKDGTIDDTGFGTLWIVGVFLVAGIGIGFLISGRNKRKQQP
ncbi:prenyltransferase/squalene oxidase repeat-containing protein [Streptomyces turgidiscabies]|uniref:Prenyltransferase and squalene oxidase repeat protein n=1 Tax=Streptomyces turgidiscabies (strain Car8) TaxID=698760 RepID=L7F0R7_STRT8|nr:MULTISPECIES: prenyltransferase/squalene oxidase repeat-containing protein [Streptomyces]ELP64892.1 prenyltransferase and squalene oxidase repeat protein [Streptomyces turgidiscabies Car8]MDX3494292.1 terpene cyclase/mutase family protein [Streptomyces turgidiscabies]GAQ68334.1 prenyltransferase and squalene oxidase repeat [Streptomyces turgidiscabies]